MVLTLLALGTGMILGSSDVLSCARQPETDIDKSAARSPDVVPQDKPSVPSLNCWLFPDRPPCWFRRVGLIEVRLHGYAEQDIQRT